MDDLDRLVDEAVEFYDRHRKKYGLAASRTTVNLWHKKLKDTCVTVVMAELSDYWDALPQVVQDEALKRIVDRALTGKGVGRLLRVAGTGHGPGAS